MRFVALLAFAVCIVSGCGKEANGPSALDESSNDSLATQRDLTSSRPNVVSPLDEKEITLTLAGLKSVDAEFSIEDKEWTTEALNDTLSERLKQLEKQMKGVDRVDAATLSSLVHPSFRCRALRPSNLKQVFHDDAFVVKRASNQTGNEPGVYNGAVGMATALKELLNPATDAADIDVTFKIFRLSIHGEQSKAALYYHLRAPIRGGMLQQNAVWQCVWERAESGGPELLRSIAVTDFEEIFGRGSTGPLFTDCTETVLGKNDSYHQQLAYGLDHWLDRIETRFGIDISGWQGLAVADVNGDELDDLYLCQGGGLPNRLFLQNTDGTLTDRSVEAGVDWRDHSHAAVFVDLDNDGDQDLVLGTVLGLIIMANDGKAKFNTVAAKSIPEAPPLSISVADFDNDGKLDIFAACYSIRGGNSQKRRFLGRPIPYHDANNGGRNVLFRNEGQWVFRDVTQAVGLHHRRFSMAAAWEDYDNDGDLDLYVANDYGRNNLYRNDNGHFTDVASTAGVEDISAGMSVSWGDFNHDGWMDLYVSNMFSSAGNRIAYQRQFQENADTETRAAFQRHARGNSLFVNSGDGSFRDVSVAAGVTMGRWSWGSRFVDINNDGWEDLFVANGFITQPDPDDL